MVSPRCVQRVHPSGRGGSQTLREEWLEQKQSRKPSRRYLETSVILRNAFISFSPRYSTFPTKQASCDVCGCTAVKAVSSLRGVERRRRYRLLGPFV